MKAFLGPITFFDFISHLGRSKELSGIPLGIHEDIDEIFAIRPVSPWKRTRVLRIRFLTMYKERTYQ